MKIGLDFDDVLVDTNTALCDFHNVWYGTRLTRDDIISYNLHEVWGVSKDESVRRWHEFVVSTHHQALQPVLGAIQAVLKLQSRHEIIVITSRPESIKKETHALFERYFPSLLDSIFHAHHFWHDEGLGTKRELCERHGVEVIVDDALHHIEDVAPVVKCALLFDAPWNRRGTLASPNVKRVRSWTEILQAIEES